MGEQSKLGKRIVKEMQKDKLIDELFEAVASLTLRVNHLEQIADWQRELALQEISKMSQEQGYDDTENSLIYNDKVMESAKLLVEEIERHKETISVRGEERDVTEFIDGGVGDCTKKCDKCNKLNDRDTVICNYCLEGISPTKDWSRQTTNQLNKKEETE